MFKLRKYLKNYTAFAIIGPVLKLLEALMETFVPFIMKDIIDNGIRGGDTAYVLKRGAILVILAVLGWVFAISAQYFSARASMGFGMNVRNALFSKILSMDRADIDRFTVPSLITRSTNDVSRAQTGLNLFLRLILRNPFVIIGSIIMTGFINLRIMIVYIILVPVICIIMYLTYRFSRPFYDKIQKAVDGISRYCRENIIGVRSVRAFRMQKKETADFEGQTGDLFENQLRADRIAALTTPLNTLIVNGCIIFVLLVGASFVDRGLLLSGSIIALVNYLFQILLSVERTANLIDSFNKAEASSQRICEVLYDEASGDAAGGEENTASESEFTPVPDAPAVSFRNVSFRYGGSSRDSLSDISFSLKKGESLGVIGGTGSGKTTLISLLQGIYPVSEGSVSLFGRDLKTLSAAEIRRLFSVVPQKSVLFRGTVRDNVKFGNPAAGEEEIWTALEQSAAADFVREKPGELDYLIEYGGRNLSGGQKQRIALARAFVRNAEILIMDDSTSALDYVTEAKIRKYAVNKETKAPTKVIVSQRISAVSVCDRILVLEDGVLKGFGTHSELLESCRVYREIYLSQTGEWTEEEL